MTKYVGDWNLNYIKWFLIFVCVCLCDCECAKYKVWWRTIVWVQTERWIFCLRSLWQSNNKLVQNLRKNILKTITVWYLITVTTCKQCVEVTILFYEITTKQSKSLRVYNSIAHKCSLLLIWSKMYRTNSRKSHLLKFRHKQPFALKESNLSLQQKAIAWPQLRDFAFFIALASRERFEYSMEYFLRIVSFPIRGSNELTLHL